MRAFRGALSCRDQRRLAWPDQRECNLDDAAGKAQCNADAPGQGVGAERVVDQPSTVSAEERTDLVAHEGKALDHRLPFQPEHFRDGARNQRSDTHPQEAHDGAEQQRAR